MNAAGGRRGRTEGGACAWLVVQQTILVETTCLVPQAAVCYRRDPRARYIGLLRRISGERALCSAIRCYKRAKKSERSDLAVTQQTRHVSFRPVVDCQSRIRRAFSLKNRCHRMFVVMNRHSHQIA